MDYRDIIGFSKKKQKFVKKAVTPTPPKPSITKKLKEEFGSLNEWNDTSFRDKPRRWGGAFNGDSGLTEFEKQGGKDNVNEGPAYEYEPYMHAISQNYDKYWKSVKDLGRALEKKGLKKQSKELFMAYRKQVSKFEQWFSKFSGGLM